MFHLSLGLLLLFSGHLTSQVIQTNTNLTTVTDSTTAPTSPTLCYSNTCGGYPPIPWCVQTCPSNHTRCLALYSTDLQRGGVATPISFRCAYSEDGCGSSTCDPGIISEAGLFSCCCTGKLCNYVPAVVAMPSSADSAMCETFSCTDASHCSHGYATCSGPQACEATYRKNTKGTYSLVSKQCKGSSSPVQCVPGQCVVETGSGNSTVSCCCYGDKCNVNVTFTVPSQVQPVSYLLSTCGSVGTMYILNGNPVCACPSGYVLGADQWTCLDINECSLDNGGCASGCVNTPGSYTCTCQKDLGFFLADDGRSCITSMKCSSFDCQTATSACDYNQVQYCLSITPSSSSGTYSESSIQDQHCTTGYRTDANGTLVPALGACFVGAKQPGRGKDCVLQQSAKYPQNYYCLCVGDMCNHPQYIAVPLRANLTALSSSTSPRTPKASLSSSPLHSSRLSQQQDTNTMVAVGATIAIAVLIVGIAFVVVVTYRYRYACRAEGTGEHSKEALPSPAFSEVEPPWGAASHSAEMWLGSGKKEAESEAVTTAAGGVPERLEVIGCGQFAKVFKARVKSHVVAVKVFDGGKRGRECWARETEIYRTPMLKHENVVTFISSGRSDSELWFVMDFYPGGSLHDFLRTHVLDLQALCDLASSASSGLAHLHGEIVINQVVVKPSIAHRDLKSKNILVKPDGTCAIGDFGLALTFSSSDVEDKEMQGQVGTSRYMAPEILEGCVNFSLEDCLKIDIYAFALILWEMASRTDATGDGSYPVEDYKPPFHSQAPLNPTIEQMKEIVVVHNLRPDIPPMFTELQSFVSIIQDSWETDVLARLTASCIEARLKTFRSCHAPRPASSQSKDSGLAESRQSPLGTVTPRSGHASSCSTHCGEARLQPSLSVSGSITSPGGRKPPCGHYFCRPPMSGGVLSNDESCPLCESPPSLYRRGEGQGSGLVAAGSVGAFQRYDNRLANSGSLTETTV